MRSSAIFSRGDISHSTNDFYLDFERFVVKTGEVPSKRVFQVFRGLWIHQLDQNYQNWGAKFPSTSMLGIFKSSSSEIFQFHVGMYLPSYNRYCTDIRVYLIVVHVQSYWLHVLFFHVVFFLKFMKIFSAPYALIHNNKYEELLVNRYLRTFQSRGIIPNNP